MCVDIKRKYFNVVSTNSTTHVNWLQPTNWHRLKWRDINYLRFIIIWKQIWENNRNPDFSLQRPKLPPGNHWQPIYPKLNGVRLSNQGRCQPADCINQSTVTPRMRQIRNLSRLYYNQYSKLSHEKYLYVPKKKAFKHRFITYHSILFPILLMFFNYLHVYIFSFVYSISLNSIVSNIIFMHYFLFI